MPLNKDAISRYLLIDEILRSPRLRQLDEIAALVSEKMGRVVPRRTIQYDINEMKNNSILNLQAPIQTNKVGFKTFFSYSDKNYSLRKKLAQINNMTLIEVQDEKLADAVDAVLWEVEVQDALINVQAFGYVSH